MNRLKPSCEAGTATAGLDEENGGGTDDAELGVVCAAELLPLGNLLYTSFGAGTAAGLDG